MNLLELVSLISNRILLINRIFKYFYIAVK